MVALHTLLSCGLLKCQMQFTAVLSDHVDPSFPLPSPVSGSMYIAVVCYFRCYRSFIHSGHFYSAPSSPLLLRGASDYSTGYCIGVSPRSAQATAGKGLLQGPYVAARAGVEPTTLRLKVIVSTKAPPRPWMSWT